MPWDWQQPDWSLFTWRSERLHQAEKRIARTSPATASRDLADLVEQGAMTRTGERRHTRYRPAVPLRPVGTVTITPEGRVLVEGGIASDPDAAPGELPPG